MTEPDRNWTQTVNDAEGREEAWQRERASGNAGWDDGVSIGTGCTFVLFAALLLAGACLLLLIAPGLDCASEGDPEGFAKDRFTLNRAADDEPLERCGQPQPNLNP